MVETNIIRVGVIEREIEREDIVIENVDDTLV